MTDALDDATLTALLRGVDDATAAHAQAWPGAPAGRQPIQVLYVPADRVTATTCTDAGREARRVLAAHAGDATTFAEVFGLGDPELATRVRDRVDAKLGREPVEDLRVDFEDGYLGRDAPTEARDAAVAARAVAAAGRDGILSPFVGLRVKPFCDGMARRSVATLDRFVGELLDAAGGLPDGFVVTFPKIVAVDHVHAFVEVLAALEATHGLAEGALRFEAQIETTASVLDASGRPILRDLQVAGAGRMVAAHVGIFDYTAALGLPPSEQRLDHPACDLLRHLLQLTFAGTSVRLSDGSTNAVPSTDTAAELHRVWRRHGADVRHSLRHGYVQGWDLHPSQLVSRYAVVYAHLLDGIEEVQERLDRWRRSDRGASELEAPEPGVPGDPDGEAADRGGVLDEPATIRRLEAQLHRAVDCGAVPDDLARPDPG